MLQFDQLSYWEQATYLHPADYLIIGSGIVGLSTAIHIKQRYPTKKVTVLERGYLPTGASTKNAGFACIGSPSELLDDLTHISENEVFETLAKRHEGLQYLRNLLGDRSIEFIQNGSHELFLDSKQKEFESCLHQIDYLNEAIKNAIGVENCFVEDSKICKNHGFNGFKYAIKHQAEGQLNTGKMMRALLQLAHQHDVTILNGIAVNKIEKNKVVTPFGEINYGKLAVCTNGFAQTLLPDHFVEPARAQVLITHPIENLHFKGIFHFDAGYYYFRNVGNRILFGGGRNLNKTQEKTTKIDCTPDIQGELKRILSAYILPNQTVKIAQQWAGIMGVGKSKKPIIEQVKDDIYCGVQLGGMGVAIGTLTGKELAELMS